MVPAPPQWSIK